jgi:hypothetical protein
MPKTHREDKPDGKEKGRRGREGRSGKGKKRCVEKCGAKFRERVSDITYFKEILERLIYRGYSVFFFF